MARPKHNHSYAAMHDRGSHVTAYAFAKYMGVPYYQIKNMLIAGKLKKVKLPNGEMMLPNPARDPALVDAEWDPGIRAFVTMCPGLRSLGLME